MKQKNYLFVILITILFWNLSCSENPVIFENNSKSLKTDSPNTWSAILSIRIEGYGEVSQIFLDKSIEFSTFGYCPLDSFWTSKFHLDSTKAILHVQWYNIYGPYAGAAFKVFGEGVNYFKFIPFNNIGYGDTTIIVPWLFSPAKKYYWQMGPDIITSDTFDFAITKKMLLLK